MPTTPPLTAPRSLMRKWRRRKELWDRTYSVLFRAIQEEELPQPVEGEVPARTWEQAHGQPIDGAMTGAPTPDDEYSEAKAIVRKGVVKLRGRFPQLMPGLPQIPAEPEALMDQVWSKAHQRAFGERPRLPGVLREGLDLGKLATMGPFSTHVSREGDTYQIDLSLYQGLPHQDGLRHLATRTILRQEGELLQATEIECIAEGTRFRPGDEGWTEASRLVACGLYTHATIVKHLAVCHVFVNASFSVAARNTLPAAHPLMALLWPHLHGNLDVNNTLGPALVDE
ncbi:MAG: hypothetical protein H6741_35450, partial [Alphaproteobacteria bacterium]|nr:hypothetical protein [Alphaproteobacteria bacterium]